MRLYRLFVIILIGSLIIGSIVSIGIFLFGEFGSTESRILGSIASLGFFSLAGLCSSTVADIERYRKVSIAGAISSIVAFQLVIGAIWELMEMDWFVAADSDLSLEQIAFLNQKFPMEESPRAMDVALKRVRTCSFRNIMSPSLSGLAI